MSTKLEIKLSPEQQDRMERLEARYPGTTFDLVDQNPVSMAVEIEADTSGNVVFATMTVSGHFTPDSFR